MPFVYRTTSLPTTAEIVRVPQIVIVDQTGPTIPLGTSPGVAMLVAESLKGDVNSPTELSGGGQAGTLFGPLSVLLSQDAAGVQNAGGVGWEGNGMFQLLSKTFKRLGFTRVDTECVTTDGGSTKSQLAVTVTVAAADQTAGVLNRDILVKAGTQFGTDNTFAVSTAVMALSQDLVFLKGATVTSNAVTGNCNCFSVKRVEPIATVAAASIDSVIDSALDNVSAGTSVTGVTNASALWPPGTGTTLAARIASKYPAAITATAPGTSTVTVDTVVVWSARRTTLIRQALLANAVASSEQGRGRIAIAAAEPAASSTSAAAASGVTAAMALAAGESLQSDRMILTFPMSQIVTDQVTGASGTVTATINADGWMASILSNFANERNPGANPAPLLDSISNVEAAYAVNPLSKTDYANLLASGICPLQKDRTVGWWFLNGITAANRVTQPTRVPAKRRRMADEIQDSLAGLAAPYLKEPATTERVDAFVGEIESYLEGLLAKNRPGAQRIVAFAVDATSLNTADLTAIGIYTIGVWVRLLSSMDDIIFQTQIGETVNIPAEQAA